jgi:DNA-binding response OmpR family regulator
MTALAQSGTLLLVGFNGANGHGANGHDFGEMADLPGWTVERVETPRQTLDKLESSKVDGVIFVIFVGWAAGQDGLRLLSAVRERWVSLPLVVVGTADCEEDLIQGLEAGADDYIVMPCSDRQFAARVQASMRRNSRGRGVFAVGDLEVWEESRVAFRSGRPIRLSTKEMEILLFLAANQSKPVSRQTLLQKVFNLSFEPGTNLVEVHIHRLREKLDGGHGRQLLKTVRGQGYVLGSWLGTGLLVLSADVEWAFFANAFV